MAALMIRPGEIPEIDQMERKMRQSRSALIAGNVILARRLSNEATTLGVLARARLAGKLARQTAG
jgi:hypothetical protein